MPILIPQFFTALLTLGLGGFVWFRFPDSPLHRAFAFVAASIFLWLMSQAIYVPYTGSPEQAALWSKICYLGVPLIPVTLYHFVSHVGGLAVRRSSLQAAYVLAGIFILLAWGSPWLIGLHQFPWGYFVAAGPLHPLFLLFFFWLYAKSLYHLWCVSKDGNQTTSVRNQARVLFVIFLLTAFAAVDYLPEYGLNVQPKGFLFIAIFFSLMAYTIVRHQLLDIRVVIRKSLVYSSLIACMTATYLVVVLVAEKWFQNYAGYRSWPVTVIVAFLIALFFNPLRNQIQAFVDRALFKATPIELLERQERLLTELRKTDQMKAVAILAAGLAHEIKNPLTAIKTFTEFLPTRHTDAEFREKFHRIVGKEVTKIDQIVRHLLDFAKPVPTTLQPP